MTVFKAYPRPFRPTRGRRLTSPVRIDVVILFFFCTFVSHTECLLQRTNLIPDDGTQVDGDYLESHNLIEADHNHDQYQEQEGEGDDEGEGLFEDVHQGQHRHEGRCIEQTAHEPKVRSKPLIVITVNVISRSLLSRLIIIKLKSCLKVVTYI